MTFTAPSIRISKACTELTITLNHIDKLPINVMGHKLIISKADDMAAIVQEGISADPTENFLKPDDKRAIGHTRLIGGGQQTSVTLKNYEHGPSELGEPTIWFLADSQVT